MGLWLLLALTPVVAMVAKTVLHEEEPFALAEVLHVWLVYAIFFVPFLLHNFLVAPLLIYERRRRAYFVGVAVIIVLFFAYQMWMHPSFSLPSPSAEELELIGEQTDAHVHPPFFYEQMGLINTIVLFLILGMNLGVKLYFKQEYDRKLLVDLERKHLEQQLQYLKFQINPHFFMNTLNNIHALVDIDPEKAKKSIVVLSKMMRYLLYDGNLKLIPLEKEVSFIEHFIILMRLRYTEHVHITVKVPEHTPQGQIPPLVLFTFVENAFKHGVTYQKDCFISIQVEIDGEQVHLCCRNSKAEQPIAEQGGVGMANVMQRLDIVYEGAYELHVNDEADAYEVNLRLPANVTLPSQTN